jgi:transposase-like protein
MWLYFRFPLSLRMVEQMLAARGIVSATREGRVTFKRILTSTLRSVTRKIDQMLL